MTDVLDISPRDVRDTLAKAMLADRVRVGRRLHGLERSGDPDPQRLLRLFEQATRSAERADARRASVPTLNYPDDLPVTHRRDEIRDAITRHRAVVVCGETGSGKTTQLPKICLEAGRGVYGLIGHTQPRRLAARTVAARVAHELGSPGVGGAVGYKVRFHDETSPLSLVKLMTDGILLAELQGDRFLNDYDTLIVDEAHERSLNIDFLLGHLKNLLDRRPDLKVVVTSATIDPGRFSDHFGGPSVCPVINVTGRTYPVEVRYQPPASPDGDPDDLHDALIHAIDELGRDPAVPNGDTLVFLPGEREIRDAAKALSDHAGGGGRHGQYGAYDVLPLYARLSNAEQNRVFNPSPGGRRRVVLATNVAETSLTVPGIRSVVDTGVARVSRYSAKSKVQRLPVEAISRASADQRKGRCGRVAPGVCVRLYDETDFDNRPEFTDPEIQRTNLAQVILQMEAFGLGSPERFGFIDPPDPRQVRDGYQTLAEIGALDEHRRLTHVGRLLASLPVDPKLGRMILAARDEDCVDEMLIITAGLSIQDPRERPIDRAKDADAAHAQWKAGGSDFLTLVNLWRWYARLRRDTSRSKLRQSCRQNFLSCVRMMEWGDLQRQLRETLAGLPSPERTSKRQPHGKRDTVLMREVTQPSREVTSGAREVTSGAREITQPSREVTSGAREITQASREITSGAREVTQPSREITSGAREITQASREVTSGACEVTSGAGEVTSGGFDDVNGTLRHDAEGPTTAPGVRGGWRLNTEPASADQVHRAVLPGLLANVGKKTDSNEYEGVRGRRFFVFPGSVVFGSKPQWLVSAELVETTRLYARTACSVRPEWVEEAAGDLAKRTYGEPYWQMKTGRVLAPMKVSLWGLQIAGRAVDYGKIDPKKSRTVFIRNALVAGDFESGAAFFRHNRDLVRDIELLEAKTRRRDLLVDAASQFAFYDARIPADVVDQRSFERWRGDAERGDRRLLHMTREELIGDDLPDVAAEGGMFPDTLDAGGVVLPLAYRFDPGHVDDGVTATVTLEELHAVDADRLDWLVPGLIAEKVADLIRTLPKTLRTRFVPVPEVARRAVRDGRAVPYGRGNLAKVLARFLATESGLEASELEGGLRPALLSAYLHLNVRVVDVSGVEVDKGRDVRELRRNLKVKARGRLKEVPDPRFTRDGITSWDVVGVGDLPLRVETRGVEGFVALVDQGDAAGLRLFETAALARRQHRRGVRRLLMLEYASELRHRVADVSDLRRLELWFMPLGQAGALRRHLGEAAGDRLFAGVDPADVRTRAAFEERVNAAWGRLGGAVKEASRAAGMVLSKRHEVSLALEAAVPDILTSGVGEMQEQVRLLVPPDFLVATPASVLPHVPRFLEAVRQRHVKLLDAGLERDSKLATSVWPYWKAYLDRLADAEAGPLTPPWERLRWLIEEYRVSLWAQSLGTPVKVSEKVLSEALASAEGT